MNVARLGGGDRCAQLPSSKGEVALEALWLTFSGPETSSGLTDVHVSCIFALHGTARDSLNVPNQRSLR